MQINGAVALVTGANRGLGEQFTKALLERGAAKVYAGARDPESVRTPGVVPVRLDITDARQVRAAAEAAPDVTLLINNAGLTTGSDVLAGTLDDWRLEFDTHVLGTLRMSRAFAPALAANGGGALLNVLSVLSWLGIPRTAAYTAAKSAQWSLTNSLRLALAEQGTLVTGLHVGLMDTRIAAGQDAPKADPAKVAALALEGIEAEAYEVLADDMSRQVRAALSGELAALYPQLSDRA
ncbi:SDR family oxidoreductase [Kitasatospora sp. NPDC057512]|uniref:SDR family oxidoreductase n=1 Tax=Kitasatospora sp. NPDC057512 TaxID=3346154 RepID=UPI0036A917AA